MLLLLTGAIMVYGTYPNNAWERNWKRLIETTGLTMQTYIDMGDSSIINVTDVTYPNGSSCCGGGAASGDGDNASWNETYADTLYATALYQNRSIYFNKTFDSYSGNLSLDGYDGYLAGDYICDKNFSGTHLCDQYELLDTRNFKDISSLASWTGDVWVISGSSKYTGVGVLLVNDCNGFKHGVSGSYYGNFALLGSNIIGTQHCGNSLPLACCRVW